MTNGSEGIAEYPGRRTGPGTGFTVGNRFVDEAHPGQVFVIGRTVTALGNVDVYDTEGRYHLITRCTIVGGPVDKPGRPDYTALIEEVRELFAEGWCVCRSSHLPGDMLAAVEALVAERDQADAVMLAIIDATSGPGDGPSEGEMVAGVVDALTMPAVEKARMKWAALRVQLAAAEALIREMGDATDIRHGGKLDRLDRIAMLAAAAPSTVLGDVIREAKAEALDQAADRTSRLYAGTDGSALEKAWIGGVDSATGVIRGLAAEYRSEGGDRGRTNS